MSFRLGVLPGASVVTKYQSLLRYMVLISNRIIGCLLV